MASPIGISVGDFIAVGQLIGKISNALKQGRGATADYRSLISALSSLGQCIRSSSSAILSLQLDPHQHLNNHEKPILNGIQHEVQCCKALLEGFLCSSQKYTESLLHSGAKKRLKDEWRKVIWFVYKAEDVSRLERDLKMHMQAFQIYMVALLQSVKVLPVLTICRVLLISSRSQQRLKVVQTVGFSCRDIAYNADRQEPGCRGSHRRNVHLYQRSRSKYSKVDRLYMGGWSSTWAKPHPFP